MIPNIETGQSVQARDFAQALAGQSGTFLVTRPGSQSLVVVCQEGYSIKSVRAVGSSYPTVPLGLSQDQPWDIEKLNAATEVLQEIGEFSQGDASRRQQSQQQSGSR